MPKPKKRTPSKTKPKKEAAGCSVTLKWSLLPNPTEAEFVRVWIPRKRFEEVVAHFTKATKSKRAKERLQARLPNLGMEQNCGGECEGGGGAYCQWLPVPPGPDPETIVEVCDCFYNV
jgi:hypothetical protein